MPEGTIIGVDLGGTKVTAGVVADGLVTRLATRRVPAQDSEAAVLDAVVATIAEVFDAGVVGIGCGVPSVVDVASGIVFEVENIPSWRRVPLKDVLERRFRVPASINNDANAFAVGEHVFGAGRGHANLVGITLGTGLGAGVIIEDRLYCGRNCGAGEIGKIPHRDATLEDYCSGRFFPRTCGEQGVVVYERARAGDPEALAAFAAYGRELASAVSIAVYAFDPEAIVFGGSIRLAWDLFSGTMHEELDRSSYTPMTDGLTLARSQLDNAAVLGAAALYVERERRRVGG
jgi:glucokinase